MLSPNNSFDILEESIEYDLNNAHEIIKKIQSLDISKEHSKDQYESSSLFEASLAMLASVVKDLQYQRGRLARENTALLNTLNELKNPVRCREVCSYGSISEVLKDQSDKSKLIDPIAYSIDKEQALSYLEEELARISSRYTVVDY